MVLSAVLFVSLPVLYDSNLYSGIQNKVNSQFCLPSESVRFRDRVLGSGSGIKYESSHGSTETHLEWNSVRMLGSVKMNEGVASPEVLPRPYFMLKRARGGPSSCYMTSPPRAQGYLLDLSLRVRNPETRGHIPHLQEGNLSGISLQRPHTSLYGKAKVEGSLFPIQSHLSIRDAFARI